MKAITTIIILFLVALFTLAHSSCSIEVILKLRTTFMSGEGENYLYDVAWINNGTQNTNYEWYFVVLGDSNIEIDVRQIWNLVLFGSGDPTRTHETFGPSSEYTETYTITPGETYTGGGFVTNTPLVLVGVYNVICS